MSSDAGFEAFVKELSSKQLAETELPDEAKEQLWSVLTENEKQRYQIASNINVKEEETEKEAFCRTETSDKALLRSLDQLKKCGIPQDYNTVELFPKKDYDGYLLIMDGHRLYCNTKHGMVITYRCKFHPNGCFVRARLTTGNISTVNVHENHPPPHENFHYRCPYQCKDLVFTDLNQRKKHILETPHPRFAPWPIDPQLCVFADYDDVEEGERKRKKSDTTGDTNVEATEETGINSTLNSQPNLAEQIKRVQVIQRNLFISTTQAASEQHELFIKTLSEKKEHKELSKAEKLKRQSGKRQTDKENVGSGNTELSKQPTSKSKVVEKNLNIDDEDSRYCELCDINFSTAKRKADHEFSNRHKENIRIQNDLDLASRTSLTFDKPVFTEEFLQYNKALETELRSLRKGSVELEEQNAVLCTHIDGLRGVVNELKLGRDKIEDEQKRLQEHLEDLQGEMCRVFKGLVLPKNSSISEQNFEKWFEEMVAIMKGTGHNGIKEKIRRGMKNVQIDTVML